MKTYAFQKARFITSATSSKSYPSDKDSSGKFIPEIAVAGRSNVGKSTLLRSLFRNKRLVKTSATPGKTQLINFFAIDDELIVVDLPGYGYAKVPERIRKCWGPMIQTYLNERQSIQLILFLIDIRRIPNADDFQFLEWAANSQKSVILVITKVDKVSKQEKTKNTQKILDAFNCENLQHVYYSSKQSDGIKELIININNALNSEL